MKKLSLLAVCIVTLSICGGGSCGGGMSALVNVTLSPADSATDVAVDATVTATFSAAITETVDWTKVFMLSQEGTGLYFCDSVSYDATNFVATCSHATLSGNTNYIASISNLSDVFNFLFTTTYNSN